MNQRNATVGTILAVLKERGVDYKLNGETPISEVFTDSDKTKVRDLLVTGFRKGEIEMADDSKAKYKEDKALKQYVIGLINNWVRKAPEFNGGQTYAPKNPGSRAGSGDEQIVEMKKLLSQTSDPTAKATVQAAIDARKAELAQQNAPVIDVSKLPENLRHLAK